MFTHTFVLGELEIYLSMKLRFVSSKIRNFNYFVIKFVFNIGVRNKIYERLKLHTVTNI